MLAFNTILEWKGFARFDLEKLWERPRMAIERFAPSSEKDSVMPRRFALLVLLLATGCQNGQWGLGRWGSSHFGQGSIDRQKARAVVIDPYPLNDIGPEVVGGRPREFASPLPEASRNELTARNPWNGYGGR